MTGENGEKIVTLNNLYDGINGIMDAVSGLSISEGAGREKVASSLSEKLGEINSELRNLNEQMRLQTCIALLKTPAIYNELDPRDQIAIISFVMDKAKDITEPNSIKKKANLI